MALRSVVAIATAADGAPVTRSDPNNFVNVIMNMVEMIAP